LTISSAQKVPRRLKTYFDSSRCPKGSRFYGIVFASFLLGIVFYTSLAY
uniref:Ovule protein n=1 Tax=Haemonchus placei TaxID=6290 RepID=A0A0N4W3S3_HAEPC